MKYQYRIGLFVAIIMMLMFMSTAMAKAPYVRLTGPPSERAQFVNQELVIGVLANRFDNGWVEVKSSSGIHNIPMAQKRTNYLRYTPTESGELTITAIITVDGDDRQRRSSITTLVYPTDAKGRAEWMVQTALSCVGSTDAKKYVRNTSLGPKDDWCAAFIGWCARQINIPFEAGLHAIYAGVDIYDGQTEPIQCAICRRTHQARFLATVMDKSKTPEPGDLVFFIWSLKEQGQILAHPDYFEKWHGNACHVGIITAVDDGEYTFVHGNVRLDNNKLGVALNRSTDEKDGMTYADWVVAFGRPHYDYCEK